MAGVGSPSGHTSDEDRVNQGSPFIQFCTCRVPTAPRSSEILVLRKSEKHLTMYGRDVHLSLVAMLINIHVSLVPPFNVSSI